MGVPDVGKRKASVLVVPRAWLEIPNTPAVRRERWRDGGTCTAGTAAHTLHRLCWQRTGGGDMSKLASTVSHVCAFAGTPEEIRNVRDFIGRLLDGCPVADGVILLGSELATNAVLHSASGAGGTFFVSVLVEHGWIRVEVHDLGSATAPTVRKPAQLAESGAGLRVVETIANRWGFYDEPTGRVVWFEMDWQ